MRLAWLAGAGLAGCDGGPKVVAGAGVQEAALGSFQSDAGGRVSVPFEIPAGARSALLSCGPYGGDRIGAVLSLRGPGADAIPMEGGGFRADPATDHLAILLPVSPLLPLSAGVWEAGLSFTEAAPPFDPAALTVSCALLYRIPEVDNSGAQPVIDLHVILAGTGVEGLDATGAGANASFQQAVEELRALWAPALTLGEIRYSDLDLSDPELAGLADGAINGEEELGALLRADPGDGRTLPVFVVASLDLPERRGPEADRAAGGAPAIPAPGTGRSGLAVSAEGLADPAGSGRAWARAGMRAMGLYALVEADGSAEDPLADTPACGEDADGDGWLGAAECAGMGASNLLWWEGGAGATGLSEDQSWVVRQGLWVEGG